MLTQKAQVDALTGLRNRAYLDERLATEVAHSMRTGRPMALIMMDLDHFKSLNDNYGHPFGDLVLQRVGDSLARSTRPCDAACRYGGGELAIILTDTTMAGAHSVADHIRAQMHQLALAPRGKPVAVTASFGIAVTLELASGSRDLGASALLSTADRALYSAKRDGRDCVRPLLTNALHDATRTARESLIPRRDSALCIAPFDDRLRAS